jgi:hypothetical protein
MPRPTVTIADVSIEDADEDRCLCVIDHEEHWIRRRELLDGTDIEDPGDEGTIVIPLGLAQRLRLA